MIYCNLLVFLATILAVSSSPLEDGCTVTSYSDVASAAKKCSTLIINGITVPAGKTLEIDLKEGASLTFQGTITFDYHEWKGPLMTIHGKKITVNGNGATFNGQGQLYWDGQGGYGKTKPKFLKLKTSGGSKISHIKLLNCPVHCVSINSASDTVLSDFNIDVSAGDGNGATNTDGFDVSSCTGITIENSVIKNQDDCVAVNQGSNYVFRNLTCSGGHGLSLSVGQSTADGNPNTVKNVTFSDCTVTNSLNGIHVKTHVDAGTGSVTDIIYNNIKLSGITNYGINVQQDYSNGASTGNPGSNIPIQNLVLNNIQGTMNGGVSTMAVYILCGSGGCSSWNWSGVSITNAKKSNACNYSPNGFQC